MNIVIGTHELVNFIITSNYVLFYFIKLCDISENSDISYIPILFWDFLDLKLAGIPGL